MARARAHVVVQGMVQGVGFRYSCVHEAQRRRLTGWVRNTYDGDVEAVFEGEKPDVEDMVAWCHEGPVSADVRGVEVGWQAPTGEFRSFTIKY